MNIQDIASLKNAFPHHANRLDSIVKLLHEPGKYFRAVEQVHLILQMEEERLQSYARAGKLAQDAALINVIRSRRLEFEVNEAQRAGSALMKLALSEASNAVKRDIYTSRYLQFFKKPLTWIASVLSEGEIDSETIDKFVGCLKCACVSFSALVRNKEQRKEAWAAVKIWFQGGPKRKAVATSCSYLKGKTMEFWRRVKGIFYSTPNTTSANVTTNASVTHKGTP